MNQKVYSLFLEMIDKYALFYDYNQYKRNMGYRLVLESKYKFKKIKTTLSYQQFEEYSSILQLLENLKKEHKIIRVHSSKKQIQGYIID